MQRPVMDPMLTMEDAAAVEADRFSRRRKQLERLYRAARSMARVLFSKPFTGRHRNPEDQLPLATRLAKGLGYRLLFVPIFLALAATAFVYRGTHPVRLTSNKLPAVPGVFYETIQFSGPDAHPLMAWFVPVIDAKRVLELKNKVLRGKQPAVVLVHDYNGSPSQMVPLIRPLHDRGFAVMVVGLRGQGRGWVAAQTFGLNESSDVHGALAELRKRSTINGNRIAIVGVGSGANAAVIAAAQDPGVRAMVLINPWQTPEQAIAAQVGPKTAGLQWMQQLSKWAFEVTYHVDAEDLNLARFREALSGRAILSLDCELGESIDEETITSIRDFCGQHLPTDGATEVARSAE
jgi:pimeloyl-ACP methyl ester carboxylesterase